MFILLYMLDNTFRGLIDSHFHILEMKRKDIDTSLFLNEWKQNFNGYLIDIGVSEDDIHQRIKLSEEYPNLYHTVGIHPNDCNNNLNTKINIVENNLSISKVVGIGETGLDYYWDTVDKDTQKAFFKAHIELSIKYDLPIIIHDREASQDILKILESYKHSFKGIIHCFSSTEEAVARYLELGFHISYAGNVTYKKNTDLQKTIYKVPLNRLLLETDSPYLSPVPMRGKLNSPLNLVHTYTFVANKLEIETKDLIDQIQINLVKLFSLGDLND